MGKSDLFPGANVSKSAYAGSSKAAYSLTSSFKRNKAQLSFEIQSHFHWPLILITTHHSPRVVNKRQGIVLLMVASDGVLNITELDKFNPKSSSNLYISTWRPQPTALRTRMEASMARWPRAIPLSKQELSTALWPETPRKQIRHQIRQIWSESRRLRRLRPFLAAQLASCIVLSRPQSANMRASGSDEFFRWLYAFI